MFLKRFGELKEIVGHGVYTNRTEVIPQETSLLLAHQLLKQTKERKGLVYVIGNGGSAGIASHFCTDLLRTLEIPAATLVDSNVVTCFANDYGYENVYSLQLTQKLRSNDLLVAISSSGRSTNIINAAAVAAEKDVSVITLSGFSHENPLRRMGDLNFWLDSCDYGLVETGHFFLLHTIIDTFNITAVHSEVLVGAAKD